MKKRIMTLAMVGLLAVMGGVTATAEFTETDALEMQMELQTELQAEPQPDGQTEALPITEKDGEEQIAGTETMPEAETEVETVPQAEIIISTEAVLEGETETEFSIPEAAAENKDGVPIDETCFPDKNFREYVKMKFDDNQNGILDENEIRAVTEILIPNIDISSLTGIEYFMELQKLECINCKLNNLDISKNTALRYLDCSGNNLKSLDVSKNITLKTLLCADNNLTTLDVSKNIALETLCCDKNNLKNLDVSKNTALRSLSCNYNYLTSLDVSKNTVLESLVCARNNLTKLDIGKNLALRGLQCDTNNLSELNTSKNLNLLGLSCSENPQIKLDVSKNLSLSYLACSSCNLGQLDVTKNLALQDLFCSSNNLEKLDISKNINLIGLVCDRNLLTSLDVSNNHALQELFCSFNSLEKLTVGNNTNLKYFECNGNKLVNLDLSGCPNIVISENKNPEKNTGTAKLIRTGNTWQLNLESVVGAGNADNVKITSEITGMKREGSIVFFTEDIPKKLEYIYDTGVANQFLAVVLNLSDKTCVHKFGDYATTTEPTIDKPGTATRTCTVCGATETKELPKLKGTIKLSSSTLTVSVKQTVSAKALVGGMQKGDAIKKWQSANTKIATVDKNGNITGIAAGKVKIRVKLKSGASATLKVTVQGCNHSFSAYVTTTEPTVLKAGVATRTCNICGATETKEIPKLKGTVKLSASTLTMQVKKTVSVKSLVGGMQKGDSIKNWKSLNTKIVTVDKKGNITSVAAGKAKIRVKLKSGASAILKVTVQKGTVATEAIQGLSKKLVVVAGKTVTLKPQLKPVSSTQKITYKSSDKKIVTVDTNGVVKGVKAGTAKIQVKSGNVKFIIKVKVTK